jgi:hypothetical protein
MSIKVFCFQSPLGELGVPKRGIVPPFEAHRERNEPCSFRKSCVCQRRCLRYE